MRPLQADGEPAEEDPVLMQLPSPPSVRVLSGLAGPGLRTAGALLFLVLPHGGQRTARRNAWAGMSRDASVGRARREAEQALAACEQRTAWLAAGAVERRHGHRA